MNILATAHEGGAVTMMQISDAFSGAVKSRAVPWDPNGAKSFSLSDSPCGLLAVPDGLILAGKQGGLRISAACDFICAL